MIEGMDKSLGDVMSFLENRGIADNTIILFISDNGGLSAVGRGGEAHSHNRPLKSGKGSMYEGGIRVPMLAYWPGVTKPSTVINDYVIIEDFFPSILEMAQIEPNPIIQKIDGQSFVPILKGKRSNVERPLIWHYPNKWDAEGPGIASSSTIRMGDWKLIYYHKTQEKELFNIKEDIGETSNLFEQRPSIAKKLINELSSYLRSVEAQMPIDNRTGKVIPYPHL